MNPHYNQNYSREEIENILDLPSGSRTVVISFHKRNKPIDYLFR